MWPFVRFAGKTDSVAFSGLRVLNIGVGGGDGGGAGCRLLFCPALLKCCCHFVKFGSL